MPELGKALVILGIAIAVVGLVLWSGIGRGWLGQLPGDFRFQRGNVRVYFPLATCVILSVLVTLVSWLFRRR